MKKQSGMGFLKYESKKSGITENLNLCEAISLNGDPNPFCLKRVSIPSFIHSET